MRSHTLWARNRLPFQTSLPGLQGCRCSATRGKTYAHVRHTCAASAPQVRGCRSIATRKTTDASAPASLQWTGDIVLGAALGSFKARWRTFHVSSIP